jgi:hypothetical protein
MTLLIARSLPYKIVGTLRENTDGGTPHQEQNLSFKCFTSLENFTFSCVPLCDKCSSMCKRILQCPHYYHASQVALDVAACSMQIAMDNYQVSAFRGRTKEGNNNGIIYKPYSYIS